MRSRQGVEGQLKPQMLSGTINFDADALSSRPESKQVVDRGHTSNGLSVDRNHAIADLKSSELCGRAGLHVDNWARATVGGWGKRGTKPRGLLHLALVLGHRRECRKPKRCCDREQRGAADNCQLSST